MLSGDLFNKIHSIYQTAFYFELSAFSFSLILKPKSTRNVTIIII